MLSKDRKEKDPAYEQDGVFKVEQIDQDVDLITMRQKIDNPDAVVYQQITWNRKTFSDKRIRILTCF